MIKNRLSHGKNKKKIDIVLVSQNKANKTIKIKKKTDWKLAKEKKKNGNKPIKRKKRKEKMSMWDRRV